jgi:DNA replication licensing factor MCM4
MHFPSSSPVKPNQTGVNARQISALHDSDPLDFPSSPVKAPATPPVNRRGDIHSSLALTPTPRRAQRRAPRDANVGSDHLPSTAPTLSAEVHPSSEPDEIRAIWGTTVNLAETMALFRSFLTGFKPKYRVSYDRSLNLRTASLPSPEVGERLLYEEYLRQMRITGETNLNIDVVNLSAYPRLRSLLDN